MATQIKIIVDRGNRCSKEKDEIIPESNKLKYFSALKDNCYQIDKASLVPNTSIGFNILTQVGTDIKIAAKATVDSPFVITDVFLRKMGVPGSAILIEKSMIPVYKEYLVSMTNSPSLSDTERSERNTIIFKEDTKILIKELLENPRSGEKIKAAKRAVGTIVELLVDNKDALRKLLSLSRYDYYTYTHCLNVATLSIGLGMELSLNKK